MQLSTIIFYKNDEWPTRCLLSFSGSRLVTSLYSQKAKNSFVACSSYTISPSQILKDLSRRKKENAENFLKFSSLYIARYYCQRALPRLDSS